MTGQNAPTARAGDLAAIREVIENWVIWRDNGDWERFAGLWHPGARMSATWFDGPAEAFIAASRSSLENGANVQHLLGATSIDMAGQRAVAQTRMTILQRAELDGVEVDVECVGRFVDFFECRNGRWAIMRRQPVYDKDRITAVRPGESLHLDEDLLTTFPVGYRHIGYLQTRLGLTVGHDLPGPTGAAADRLREDARNWLSGASHRPPGR